MNALVIYIMGVSGSGKTTIGRKLSAVLNLPFFDADDLHPATNKEKMRSGIPLNDNDREDWLLAIHQLAKEEGRRKGAIIACSALKEKYRAILSKDIKEVVRWVFLQGDAMATDTGFVPLPVNVQARVVSSFRQITDKGGSPIDFMSANDPVLAAVSSMPAH